MSIYCETLEVKVWESGYIWNCEAILWQLDFERNLSCQGKFPTKWVIKEENHSLFHIYTGASWTEISVVSEGHSTIDQVGQDVVKRNQEVKLAAEGCLEQMF